MQPVVGPTASRQRPYQRLVEADEEQANVGRQVRRGPEQGAHLSLAPVDAARVDQPEAFAQLDGLGLEVRVEAVGHDVRPPLEPRMPPHEVRDDGSVDRGDGVGLSEGAGLEPELGGPMGGGRVGAELVGRPGVAIVGQPRDAGPPQGGRHEVGAGARLAREDGVEGLVSQEAAAGGDGRTDPGCEVVGHEEPAVHAVDARAGPLQARRHQRRRPHHALAGRRRHVAGRCRGQHGRIPAERRQIAEEAQHPGGAGAELRWIGVGDHQQAPAPRGCSSAR